MDYTFLFYIFLSFVVSAGGSYILFSSGRTIAALLYFVGILSIEIYFGTKWFTPSGDKVTGTPGAWPPSINVCPDYLSLYKDSTGTYYCVDTMGITASSPLAQPSPWTSTSTVNASKTNVFKLYTDQTGTQRLNSIIAQMKTIPGLTWEGVYDGSTPLGGTPPLPVKV